MGLHRIAIETANTACAAAKLDLARTSSRGPGDGSPYPNLLPLRRTLIDGDWPRGSAKICPMNP